MIKKIKLLTVGCTLSASIHASAQTSEWLDFSEIYTGLGGAETMYHRTDDSSTGETAGVYQWMGGATLTKRANFGQALPNTMSWNGNTVSASSDWTNVPNDANNTAAATQFKGGYHYRPIDLNAAGNLTLGANGAEPGHILASGTTGASSWNRTANWQLPNGTWVNPIKTNTLSFQNAVVEDHSIMITAFDAFDERLNLTATLNGVAVDVSNWAISYIEDINGAPNATEDPLVGTGEYTDPLITQSAASINLQGMYAGGMGSNSGNSNSWHRNGIFITPDTAYDELTFEYSLQDIKGNFSQSGLSTFSYGLATHVPEPSVSILGLLGGLLCLRRSRA